MKVLGFCDRALRIQQSSLGQLDLGSWQCKHGMPYSSLKVSGRQSPGLAFQGSSLGLYWGTGPLNTSRVSRFCIMGHLLCGYCCEISGFVMPLGFYHIRSISGCLIGCLHV